MDTHHLKILLDAVTNSIGGVLPELLIAGLILLHVTVDLISSKYISIMKWGIYALHFVLAFILLGECSKDATYLFSNTLFVAPITQLGKLILVFGSFVSLLILENSAYKKNGIEGNAEYYTLWLSFLLSCFILVSSNHYLVLFTSFETISLCSYLLVLFHSSKISREASIKYLIFGLVSAGIMLYGISLLFVASGNLFLEISALMELSAIEKWGLGFILLGVLFKLGAFPMHFWVPDVYEGTTHPLIAYFAIVPKLAALYFLGILTLTYGQVTMILEFRFVEIIALIAMLSITIGNVIALWQNNAKRLLGYSGVAHSGFLLIAFVSDNILGVESFLFYSFVYILMNAGALLVLSILSNAVKSDDLRDYAGLGKTNVFLGVIGIIMFSALIGLPPTVGFTAKFLIFSSIWKQVSFQSSSIVTWLFVIGLMNTAIGLFYYIKLPYFMFLKSSVDQKTINLSLGNRFLMLVLSIALVAFFVKPDIVLNFIDSVNQLAHYYR